MSRFYKFALNFMFDNVEYLVQFSFVVLILAASHGNCETNPFVDSEWFSINWPGSVSFSDAKHKIKDDTGTTVVMMSSNKEKYSCHIPPDHSSKESSETSYTGPSAYDLISQLYKGNSCSYRIESYWTYELCHGKHLKQYHGDKDEEKKTGSRMVFYLGFYKDNTSTEKQDTSEAEKSVSSKLKRPAVKTKKLENVELPYYEVVMDGGTVCELTGQTRQVTVLYVCQPEGRGEIYQLSEIALCQYQLIVLTNVLCSHPLYRPKQPTVNKIQCHGLDGAPSQPKKYSEFFPENQVSYFEF